MQKAVLPAQVCQVRDTPGTGEWLSILSFQKLFQVTWDYVYMYVLWKASGEHLLSVLVRMIQTKEAVRLSLNSFPITWPFVLGADVG